MNTQIENRAMNRTKIRVLNALRMFLRPIARLMLRNNIDFRQFTEAAKLAFVDVGTKDYGLGARPTNISRVAIMNSLTRKEVKRIRNLLDSGEYFSQIKPSICERVIRGWESDKDFLTASGKPRSLRYDSGKSPFLELARRYAPGVPHGAVRTELLRIGAVKKTKAGRFKLIEIPKISDDEADRLQEMLDLLTAAASTLEHNLSSSPGEEWPVEKIVATHVTSGDERKFRRISRKSVRRIKDEWKALAEAYEALREDGHKGQGPLPGLAVFHFEKISRDD